MGKFNLYLTFDKNFFIAISPEVIHYLQCKVIDNIITKHKVSLGNKFTYIFSVYVTNSNFPKDQERISIFERTSGNKKLCGSVVSRDFINEKEELNKEIIQCLLESIKQFFTLKFKTFNQEIFNDFITNIDLNYLLSLPFPTALSEDNIISDTVYIPPPNF